MRLAGKAAVITGANTGIGRACALRFAREGARLVPRGQRYAEAESLGARSSAAAAFALVVGATSPAAPTERAIDVCVERYGTIDILFCNAGISCPSSSRSRAPTRSTGCCR